MKKIIWLAIILGEIFGIFLFLAKSSFANNPHTDMQNGYLLILNTGSNWWCHQQIVGGVDQNGCGSPFSDSTLSSNYDHPTDDSLVVLTPNTGNGLILVYDGTVVFNWLQTAHEQPYPQVAMPYVECSALHQSDYSSAYWVIECAEATAPSPTPTPEPTPTAGMTYQFDPPDPTRPYMHEICSDEISVVTQGYSHSLTNPTYPFSSNSEEQAQGALASYDDGAFLYQALYNFKFNNFPHDNDIIVYSRRFFYSTLGSDYQVQYNVAGFLGNEDLITSPVNKYKNPQYFVHVDEDLTQFEPSATDIQNLQDYGVDIEMNIRPFRSFARFTQPLVCYYYFDNTGQNSIVDLPDTPNGGIRDSSLPPRIDYTDVCGDTYNFSWIMCAINNWFGTTMDWLFDATLTPSRKTDILNNIKHFGLSSTSSLNTIITKPLALIQSVTTTTCLTLEIPIENFGSIYLPCPRDLLDQYFPTILDLWDIISTGVIAYWISLNAFSTILKLNDPKDDKIPVAQI